MREATSVATGAPCRLISLHDVESLETAEDAEDAEDAELLCSRRAAGHEP